jgi:hypothetical protein
LAAERPGSDRAAAPFPSERASEAHTDLDQEPLGGYSLLEAFSALLTDPPHLAIFAASARAAAAEGPRRAGDAEHYRGILWAELSSRVRNGALTASGFAPGAIVPTPIHPAFFNNAVPDYGQDAVTSHGVTYGGVRISRMGTPQALFAGTREATSTKGGRPRTFDWDAFTREMVRVAWNGDIVSREDFRRHMSDWCAKNWEDQPGERTLRNEIAKRCPDEMPAK